jgi:hypothetical protein
MVTAGRAFGQINATPEEIVDFRMAPVTGGLDDRLASSGSSALTQQHAWQEPGSATVLMQPPRGWFHLRFPKLGVYREPSYF